MVCKQYRSLCCRAEFCQQCSIKHCWPPLTVIALFWFGTLVTFRKWYSGLSGSFFIKICSAAFSNTAVHNEIISKIKNSSMVSFLSFVIRRTSMFLRVKHLRRTQLMIWAALRSVSYYILIQRNHLNLLWYYITTCPSSLVYRLSCLELNLGQFRKQIYCDLCLL